MRLLHVSIERFRGVRRLDVPLDALTVVIGENNHGKTSLFDVLGLCLARRDPSLAGSFRAGDFYRPADGTPPGEIRIVLTFGPEDGAAVGPSVEPFLPALAPDRDGETRLRLEFIGNPEDGVIHRRFVDEDGGPRGPRLDVALLDRLQALHPLLLLRFSNPGSGSQAGPNAGGTAPDKRGPRGLEALIAKVYHDLTKTRDPLPVGAIARGLRAARDLFGRDESDEVTDAPMHRMLNEILSDSVTWGESEGPSGFRVTAGSGTHTVGLLLVLGALLEGRGEGALPSEASPIIAIEEPAAHLHPVLLSSTWDVVEALNAQTIVTTNSGELLSSVPMMSLRRLVREPQRIEVRKLAEDTLTEADTRRLSYHIRAKRGGVLFARCWLLVEGESEFWLMTQLAHVMGWDLEAEGVRCLDFAQCGVAPLIKLANDLGIEWHLLADGDESGTAYARDGEKHLGGRTPSERVSQLSAPNIERCLWDHGFEHVYWEAAGMDPDEHHPGQEAPPPGRVISKAVRKKSKPFLALAVSEVCAAQGIGSIPPILRKAIETSVALARESVAAESPEARP
jgi:putative ATP-dependent endonuclease of OLD family